MPDQLLQFPTGTTDAIVTSRDTFSFDDLHQLRHFIGDAFGQQVLGPPKRILGCLEDDEYALFALLFLTELSDYMPINPKLSDAETSDMVRTSGPDIAIVSRTLLDQKCAALSMINVLIWDDIVQAAVQALRAGMPTPMPLKWNQIGRLILHTSGSTGTPKRVPISLEAMNASAQNIAKGHRLAADDHALNALPTFHIGALVDVMLAPFAAQGRISITANRAPEDLVAALIKQRPTWFQVVPTLLRRLVEDVDHATLKQAGQSLRFIRSISAPVPQDLKDAVEALLGCPVIEMYGMTETAGQIATLGRDPQTHKPGSVGKPVGVEVAILDRFGNALGPGQTGEVCVRGPTVFEGYEGSTRDDVFFEHYFRTGDLGKRDPDGSLFLQGRLKEMINVGGEKVSPHEIETAALHMSDVTEAAAYAMPHPTLGEQVGLSISVRSDLTSAAVKAHLNTQLASFKCPNMITILDQLPRLANAKVDRVLLKRNAETDWKARHTATDQKARRVATGSLAPDAASFEAQAVARHWAQILKCRAPDGEDDFFDMGGDSLTATQFLLALEKTLGREISPNQLFEAPTFSGLVASLTQNSIAPNTPSPRPVRFIQENTVGWPGQVVVPGGLLRGIGSLKPGHPLFWVSQAHQEVDAILNTMGKRRPLYVTGSLRLFKRRTEQDFEVIAQQLADEIMTVQPEGPIALGGFCGGAWVMHHTAERLVQLGRQIRVLISFDYWPARRVHVPTVHGMSHCDINSARTVYGNYSVAQDLLHQKGVLSLHFEGRHEFHAQNIAPHLPVLNNILDGVQTPPKPSPAPNGTWSLDQRRSAPKAKIKLRQRPHTYKPNGQATFELDVTNTSGTIWDPTEVSGLSVQIDLINLDGCMRKANVFFGAFDTPIPPGKTVTFPVKITFPNKRIPVWLVCCLASQGVTRFQAKSSGRCKKLVFPSLF